MQTHQIKRNKPNKKKITVGRGGKRGKTSGRGHKGQKARAGHKLRPEMRDIIKKLPKRRGYGKNRARTINSSVVKPTPINLSILEEVFSDGDAVTPASLVEKGVLKKGKGRLPKVKILGMGDVTKKVKVSGCDVSESAKGKIEKAGGSVAS
jgi:large subunit ribosomal protein L15